MKIYLVGGAVRDRLLNVVAKDIDYVVVGSTPAEMLALGFEQVGASFPVFLKGGREYALARTERKTGPGYCGFETSYDPNITLEQDLIRRDLTINSMAQDEETGEIIDPHGGRRDLEAKILRHTSEAFAEDPIRVLRTARFAARYDFKIADETLELMDHVVPELDAVPAERIWTEIEKGLMEMYPHKMFDALYHVDAFRVKSMYPYRHTHTDKLALVHPHHDLVTRFALICSGFEGEDYAKCRVPCECAIIGMFFNKHFADLALYGLQDKKQHLELLYALHAFNNTGRLFKCLEVFRFYDPNSSTYERIADDMEQLNKIDAAAIAKTCETGAEVKERLFQARLAVLQD
jgi:tRNA nucleotidyltransferase (CCA-adding enzyme)